MDSAATATAYISIPLRNQTGLDENRYTIYVLGFSTASRKMLSVSDTSGKIAKFVPILHDKGVLPACELGKEICQIDIDGPVPNSCWQIDGARIYFFVADKDNFQGAPKVEYEDGGASVINVKNPPNPCFPPYSFVEFTMVDSTHGAVIDLQTVDGLTFPLNLTLNDSNGSAVGQPLSTNPGFNRNTVFAAYETFMCGIAPESAPFRDLRYCINSGGLLNPGIYLTQANKYNQLSNLESPLNSLFDGDLKTLFSNKNLSIQGVGAGVAPDKIEPDIYTVNSIGEQSLPEGTFSHPALQFKGEKYGRTLNVFSPLGLCALTFNNEGTQAAIHGQLDGTTLTFDAALPKDTKILPDMYVSGAGVEPKATTIKSVTRDPQTNKITGVVISGTERGKASPSQYGFSKIPDMFMTSGAMVFANSGVFAYAKGYTGAAATVVLNLQNQLVSALNRGVVNKDPGSTKGGYSSQCWGEQKSWYPQDTAQNLFSLFMHTATVSAGNGDIPIFIRAKDSTTCARGTTMGQAYGFAYDENAGPVPPVLSGQPDVPSKFDPLPHGVSVLTITLGAWN